MRIVHTWALTSCKTNAKPSCVIATCLPLASTRPPICSRVLTPWLSLIPSSLRLIPVLPTMYPRTPSHCFRANSSSCDMVTGCSPSLLQGTPKDLWFPPPVNARRNEAAKGLVRLYARDFPGSATALRICSRERTSRAYSRSLGKHQTHLSYAPNCVPFTVRSYP